jgi:hypothetical protein
MGRSGEVSRILEPGDIDGIWYRLLWMGKWNLAAIFLSLLHNLSNGQGC